MGQPYELDHLSHHIFLFQSMYDWGKMEINKFFGFYFLTRVMKKTQAREKTLQEIILKIRSDLVICNRLSL